MAAILTDAFITGELDSIGASVAERESESSRVVSMFSGVAIFLFKIDKSHKRKNQNADKSTLIVKN